MAGILEKLGFKNQSDLEQKEKESDRKYLDDLLKSYRQAQYNLKKVPDSVLSGNFHKADTQAMTVDSRIVEELPAQIIAQAEKLGLDGHNLITEADEQVKNQLEQRKAT